MAKFKLIWKIKNLFHCTLFAGEYLESPKITVHSLDNTEWFLRLYPRGRNFSCYIPCFLRRTDSDAGPEVINISYSISLMAMDGSYAFKREVKDHVFGRPSGFGFPDFVKRDDILSNETLYFAKNTMTIVCEMWNGDLTASSVCQVFTRIPVESRSFLWEIRNFTTRSWDSSVAFHVESASKESPTFDMELSLNPENELLEISLKREMTSNPLYLNCAFAILDIHGYNRDRKTEEHIFVPSEETWNYPPFIKKNKLTADSEVYFLRDALTLSCELNISFSNPCSEIQSYFQKLPKNNDQRICTTPIMNPKSKFNLRNDLYHLYVKQKHCDLTLQNKNDYILVHKTILCARSPVFCDMIENEASVKETGIIEINSLNSETLSRMLVFLYTDTLDNISCRTTMNLYLASVRYQIFSLKERCTVHLIENLNVDNVCDVLDFADIHFDDALKTSAQNFICQNVDDVFCSTQWKDFMANSVVLAGETMYQVFLKKL
ncbi:hypothetical protein JTE90_029585 [Oedothorax gibbosus]|uniref:Speckle-type POZ protein n=1 Tax=Oedothorax gibbosus TaxID=931172 RepID=A0AAV6VCW8_9ARAC|nr:hypothetical protein JTE90_029585 [Oedothorax gibbosus]